MAPSKQLKEGHIDIMSIIGVLVPPLTDLAPGMNLLTVSAR
jgi:hypothetical protein